MRVVLVALRMASTGPWRNISGGKNSFPGCVPFQGLRLAVARCWSDSRVAPSGTLYAYVLVNLQFRRRSMTALVVVGPFTAGYASTSGGGAARMVTNVPCYLAVMDACHSLGHASKCPALSIWC
mmetsp:Transcript_47922/g.58931  ORF Transcript_47922/g.58931 Transcript_47922/m.58931 type:complete len:124 (+) Transcript_47922:2-373(+)